MAQEPSIEAAKQELLNESVRKYEQALADKNNNMPYAVI